MSMSLPAARDNKTKLTKDMQHIGHMYVQSVYRRNKFVEEIELSLIP